MKAFVQALLLVCLVIVVHTSTLDAEEQPPYETVLLPLFVDADGAFGSRWMTQAWIENRGDYPVGAYYGLYLGSDCRFGVPCPGLIPGDTLFPLASLIPGMGRGGLLLYPDRDGASQLNFSLRVLDVQNDPGGTGTEIPVVREADFHEDRFSLLAVPNRGRFRATLRVYVLSETPETISVAVRELDSGDPRRIRGPILRTVQLETWRWSSESEDPGFPLMPSFAELSDLDNALFAGEEGDYALEITTESPDAIWGFVSITNNETGQVTLVTPQ